MRCFLHINKGHIWNKIRSFVLAYKASFRDLNRTYEDISLCKQTILLLSNAQLVFGKCEKCHFILSYDDMATKPSMLQNSSIHSKGEMF